MSSIVHAILPIAVPMANTHASILILGAGPAGCATAIRLRQLGMQVTVVWNGRSTRALTETLAAHAKPLLRGLGINEDALAIHAPSPGVVSRWEHSEPIESESIWNPYGDGLLIERQVLDEQLRAQTLCVGARLLRRCAVCDCLWDVATNRWQVDWQNGGHREQEQFDWLIDATGRSAWLARKLGAVREELDGLMGVVGRFEISDGLDHRLFLEAQQNGWLYKLDSKCSVVIGVMTDADLVPANQTAMQRWWRQCVQASSQNAVLSSGAVPELRVMKANSSRLLNPVGRRWLAVGDAAAAWDPLSSQGLAQSLASAYRAAAVVAGIEGALDDYAAWYKTEWENYRESYDYFYGQVQRWDDSTFWLRRRLNPGTRSSNTIASAAN